LPPGLPGVTIGADAGGKFFDFMLTREQGSIS
jgi:hypothetical protein